MLTQEQYNDLYANDFIRIKNVCRKYENDEELLDDLVQEVFLRAWEKRHLFDNRSAPITWLHSVAVNRAMNWQRDQIRHKQAEGGGYEVAYFTDDDSLEEYEYEQEPETSIDVSTPENIILAEELMDEIKESLTDREYDVFSLHYVEGETYDQVAATLGIARPTVATHLARVREKLEPILRDR